MSCDLTEKKKFTLKLYCNKSIIGFKDKRKHLKYSAISVNLLKNLLKSLLKNLELTGLYWNGENWRKSFPPEGEVFIYVLICSLLAFFKSCKVSAMVLGARNMKKE